jgi:hypothetical protein
MPTHLRPFLVCLLLQLDVSKFLEYVQQPFLSRFLRFQEALPAGDPWFLNTPLEGLPLSAENLFRAYLLEAAAREPTTTSNSEPSTPARMHSEASRSSDVEDHASASPDHLAVWQVGKLDRLQSTPQCSPHPKSSATVIDGRPVPSDASQMSRPPQRKRPSRIRQHVSQSRAVTSPQPAARQSIPQRARGCIRRDWTRAWERVRRQMMCRKPRHP